MVEETVQVPADWDSYSSEEKENFLKAHPGLTVNDTPAPAGAVEPVVEPDGNRLEKIEAVPAQPAQYKGTPEAGLQRIRQGIQVLETHSAAKVGGGLIGEALAYLEQGYSVLLGHHSPKKDEPKE